MPRDPGDPDPSATATISTASRGLNGQRASDVFHRSKARHLFLSFAVSIPVFAAGIVPSAAQLTLPGAVAPSSAGSVEQPAAPRPKRRPSADLTTASRRVVSPAVLAGKTFFLNAGKSQVTFEPLADRVDVAHLTLAGESISNGLDTCEIDAPGTPIAVRDAGRPDGVTRVQIAFEACPVAFDVLDGAVLVDRTQGTCEFKEKNCRVNPSGLWGPLSGDLGPDKAKTIEHARTQAELAVRKTYQALAASTKDRAVIAGFARDQAQFSSTRTEICRDYVGEGRHGFCAAKLTEARADFLRAKLDESLAAKAERKRGRKGAKP